MKKVLTFLLSVFLFTLAVAQTVPKFSYQAVVRNAANELVANDSVSVKIQFYNHEVSGNAVYSESHHVTSNRNGLISLLVGEGNEPAGDLLQVTWQDAVVRTEITVRGGYTVSDVKPITAVPLAFYAERIPLQALEEHLGSTNLVSADALRDTLAHYVTTPGLTDTLANYVTRPELSDSHNNRLSRSELSDSLTHYVPLPDYEGALAVIMAALADLGSVMTSMEEWTVPAVPANLFLLGAEPLSGMAAILYINGVCVSSEAYTVVNRQLTYLPSHNGGKELVEGDRVQFYYHHK